ncbi:hypothetical protein [uncultured Bacteroides sp.]|uniref:hypothetical protein n=1 Tax=uncultured Bacteroides sp. TaxID=162156 RepID=UPI002604D3AE|nr:hypothetical protein [uncultured Bacteroides sp.]
MIAVHYYQAGVKEVGKTVSIRSLAAWDAPSVDGFISLILLNGWDVNRFLLVNLHQIKDKYAPAVGAVCFFVEDR